MCVCVCACVCVCVHAFVRSCMQSIHLSPSQYRLTINDEYLHTSLSSLELTTALDPPHSKSRSWRLLCTTHCSRIRWSDTASLSVTCRRMSFVRPWRSYAGRCWGRAESSTVRSWLRGWSCSTRPIRYNIQSYVSHHLGPFLCSNVWNAVFLRWIKLETPS